MATNYRLDVYDITGTILVRYILEGEFGKFTSGTQSEYYRTGQVAKVGVWSSNCQEKFIQVDPDLGVYIKSQYGSEVVGVGMIRHINDGCSPAKCWCGAKAAGGGGIHLDYCNPELAGKPCPPAY